MWAVHVARLMLFMGSNDSLLAILDFFYYFGFTPDNMCFGVNFGVNSRFWSSKFD